MSYYSFSSEQPKQSTSSILRVGCAGLFGLVFVAVTVIGIVLLPAAVQLFNPAVYKHAITAQDTYDRLPGILAQMAMSSEDTGDSEIVTQYLDQDDYEQIFSTLMPADWMKTQVESLVDQEFAYLNSDQPTLVLNLSMVEVKEAMRGEGGDQVMAQIVRSWPACTTVQEQQWAVAISGSRTAFHPPECSPSEETITQAAPILGDAFEDAVSDMPDTMNLAAPSENDPQPASTTQSDPRPTVRLIRLLIFASPAIALMLLGIVMALATRSWADAFRWVGVMLLVSGILAFVAAAGFGLLVEAATTSMVQQAVSEGETGAEVLTIVLETFRYVFRSIVIWSVALAIVSGLAGLVAAVIGFMIGRSKNMPSELMPPSYG